MTPYRVLVTGSRSWRSPRDRQVLREALDALLQEHPAVTIVHGNCSRGADALAQRWAEEKARQGAKVTVESHAADWDRYGKAAGFRRNAEMVALGADVALAFIRNSSRGATDCAQRAERAGIPVRRWTA